MTSSEVEARLELGSVDPLLVFGSGDANLRLIRQFFPVRVVLRNGIVTVLGERSGVDGAKRLLGRMLGKARSGQAVDEADLLQWKAGGGGPGPRVISLDATTVRVRTPGQASYVDAMRAFDIVFSIGPAGTGKTFLAVALAVKALRDREVERILLVRPAVEAGESLGFLPGDYREKVDPYLRPLYDALGELMPPERVRKLMELGVIEIAPLAYMRGRTLNRAFVILDEAQNTTVGQMKMFLTRLGPGSKAVITGDVTQIDLSRPEDSGLKRIQPILGAVADVRFIYLTEEDVVRHRLVRDIIRAFERHEEEQARLATSGEKAPGRAAERVAEEESGGQTASAPEQEMDERSEEEVRDEVGEGRSRGAAGFSPPAAE
jgi:phosphate starvation-inducible PhoH-like protein